MAYSQYANPKREAQDRAKRKREAAARARKSSGGSSGGGATVQPGEGVYQDISTGEVLVRRDGGFQRVDDPIQVVTRKRTFGGGGGGGSTSTSGLPPVPTPAGQTVTTVQTQAELKKARARLEIEGGVKSQIEDEPLSPKLTTRPLAPVQIAASQQQQLLYPTPTDAKGRFERVDKFLFAGMLPGGAKPLLSPVAPVRALYGYIEPTMTTKSRTTGTFFPDVAKTERQRQEIVTGFETRKGEFQTELRREEGEFITELSGVSGVPLTRDASPELIAFAKQRATEVGTPSQVEGLNVRIRDIESDVQEFQTFQTQQQGRLRALEGEDRIQNIRTSIQNYADADSPFTQRARQKTALVSLAGVEQLRNVVQFGGRAAIETAKDTQEFDIRKSVGGALPTRENIVRQSPLGTFLPDEAREGLPPSIVGGAITAIQEDPIARRGAITTAVVAGGAITGALSASAGTAAVTTGVAKTVGPSFIAKQAVIAIGAPIVAKETAALTLSSEQREFVKGDRIIGESQQFREGVQAGFRATSEAGAQLPFGGGAVISLIPGAERAVFRSEFKRGAREQFAAQGLTGTELESAVGAAQRVTAAGAGGEFAGVLGINIGSELAGRGTFRTIGGQIGKVPTSTVIFETGKLGVVEGAALELSAQEARLEDFAPERALRTAEIGGLSAGAIGGVLSEATQFSTRAPERTLRRGVGKGTEIGFFTADPIEFVGDVSATGLEKVGLAGPSGRAGRVLTQTEIFGRRGGRTSEAAIVPQDSTEFSFGRVKTPVEIIQPTPGPTVSPDIGPTTDVGTGTITTGTGTSTRTSTVIQPITDTVTDTITETQVQIQPEVITQTQTQTQPFVNVFSRGVPPFPLLPATGGGGRGFGFGRRRAQPLGRTPSFAAVSFGITAPKAGRLERTGLVERPVIQGSRFDVSSRRSTVPSLDFKTPETSVSQAPAFSFDVVAPPRRKKKKKKRDGIFGDAPSFSFRI